MVNDDLQGVSEQREATATQTQEKNNTEGF